MISYLDTWICMCMSATVPCAECVVMRLRNWGHTLYFFLMVFLTLQTLYKYLPTLRTVL